jgi:hypothetical protein
VECFLGPLDHEFEFGLAYTNKQGGVPTTINFGRQHKPVSINILYVSLLGER